MNGATDRGKNLQMRFASALALIPLALIVIWLGGLIFAVCVVAVSVIAAWELGRMVEARPFGPCFWLPAAAAVAAVLVFLFVGPVLALATIAVIATLGVPFDAKCGYRLGTVFFCVIYISLPALGLVALRAEDPAGLGAASVVFAAVWATDIGAYFVGRRLGGPKLCPSVSPGKTWSGAIGGLIAAALAGVAAGWAFGAASGLAIGMVAVILSIAAQFGDLTESALKRRAGVKDSSSLIPGHGGVLDRIDGLLFASAAAFFIGAARAGLSMPAQGIFAW